MKKKNLSVVFACPVRFLEVGDSRRQARSRANPFHVRPELSLLGPSHLYIDLVCDRAPGFEEPLGALCPDGERCRVVGVHMYHR
eukprot:6974231-Prymnesium_polylepis.1